MEPSVLDGRDAASVQLEGIAASSTPPVSVAVAALARFARAEWPDAADLPAIVAAAEDLSQLEAESNATLEQAVMQLKQAEAARTFATASLEQLVTAASNSPAELGAVSERLSSIEAALYSLKAKEERSSQDVSTLRAENVELRRKLAVADADREGMSRRIDKMEYELAHVQKILEAAAQFAHEGISTA
jgi:chromosome segregation ATPase